MPCQGWTLPVFKWKSWRLNLGIHGGNEEFLASWGNRWTQCFGCELFSSKTLILYLLVEIQLISSLRSEKGVYIYIYYFILFLWIYDRCLFDTSIHPKKVGWIFLRAPDFFLPDGSWLDVDLPPSSMCSWLKGRIDYNRHQSWRNIIFFFMGI